MSVVAFRCISRILSRQTAPRSFVSIENAGVQNPWFSGAMTIRTSAPLSAEPKKKKKRVDPKREFLVKERLKKKLKKLEKVPPELIPIEDFMTPIKCLDETRVRAAPKLSFDTSEERALLLKKWSHYKHEQHLAEVQATKLALQAQMEALEELKAESEELYQAALTPDLQMFPFTYEGPAYTPPNTTYDAPDGKYNDITKVYTQ
ncbi:large ribosomal subunit protein mL40 [Nerophis lumbriciformis]|uniref:large ribosomal subunit protein mL40 n=1 Tax=Nerophis lumbriciformis TaxID=546530 RepID=UPI002ADF7DB7|nr:large ribosomal subunit protein mL40-like [Nerophis lumbriciformis]